MSRLTGSFVRFSYVGQVKLVDETFPPIEEKMVPRDLLPYLYSDNEDEMDGEPPEGVVDLEYDSDWEGFPTGLDIMSIGA